MILSFELTMPNIGSWNGQWTGESDLYFRCRNVSKKKVEQLQYKANELLKFNPKHHKSFLDGINYYYNFGDGWGANVEVKEICSHERRKLDRISKGFCGYEFMIDSIIKHGKISTL